MRTALWVFAAILALFHLGALIPWLASREFRRTRQGGDFVMIILVTGALLAVVLAKLFKP